MPCWGNCDCNLCREENLKVLSYLKENGYSSVEEWERVEFDDPRLDEFCFRYRPWLEVDEPSPRGSKTLRKKRKAKKAHLSASI